MTLTAAKGAMPPFRLNRRTVLRGAGTVAIALPWLEIMRAEPARAAAGAAKRLITVYTPGGTVLELATTPLASPPPGAAVRTKTFTGPGALSEAPGTTARSSFSSTNTVGSGLPFQ